MYLYKHNWKVNLIMFDELNIFLKDFETCEWDDLVS
jgi:hypothetical protein